MGWHVSQVVQGLPSQCEAPSSIPIPQKKKKRKEKKRKRGREGGRKKKEKFLKKETIQEVSQTSAFSEIVTPILNF
jgi:hypothetical protein